MIKKAYKAVWAAIARIMEDEVFMYAAQGSFYIMIASIPFMMLFLALLKFIIPITEHEAAAMVQTLVPAMLKEPVQVIVTEIYQKSTAIISITGVTAVWSASRGIAAVERGVKKVYKTKREGSFFKDIAFSILYTLLFTAALLITLLLMVFGGTIYGFLSSHINWLVTLEWYVGSARELMYFLGFFAFFVFLYRLFAGRGARVQDQVFGALFTSLGWFLFSFIFSVYVENFANYSYVYGSLTILVLMMLWLYSCMIIMLLGAELNMFVKNRRAHITNI